MLSGVYAGIFFLQTKLCHFAQMAELVSKVTGHQMASIVSGAGILDCMAGNTRPAGNIVLYEHAEEHG